MRFHMESLHLDTVAFCSKYYKTNDESFVSKYIVCEPLKRSTRYHIPPKIFNNKFMGIYNSANLPVDVFFHINGIESKLSMKPSSAVSIPKDCVPMFKIPQRACYIYALFTPHLVQD